ncbi:unnamed protein product [Closterium sp. NIES-53]
MYHSQLRWERKRDKAATVQPPTERSRAKEAMARAMLGEIEEHDEVQHDWGHLVEKRWVYPWEEEDEVPVQYAETVEIRLSGRREEAAVDKKREDYSWLEEAIEQQRSRKRYESEFGSGEFALMAATKEEDNEGGRPHKEGNKENAEAAVQGQGAHAGGQTAEEKKGQPQQAAEGKEWMIGDGMTEEDAVALKEVLTRYRAAFAYSLKEVGPCKEAEVTIELTTAVPVYQQRRRMTL